MATTEVTPARTSAAWIGAGAIGALLVLGGVLPGYAAVLYSDGRSPDHTLLGSGAWPYFLALALALAGLAAAAAVHGRGPAWATPALLTATGVPAFALVTELADPPEAYRPYSAAADLDDIRDIDVGPGGWITFATLLCLAVAAAVWLGRHLEFLTRRRYPVAALVAVTVAAWLGYELAEAAGPENNCGQGELVDSTEVSPYWAFWLVVYVPAVVAAAGIGAITRRRFVSGVVLIAAAAVALTGLLLVGLELSGPCLA